MMKMTIEEIVEIEFEGLSQTISHYTNDYFIKSYANKLLTIEYPKNKRILVILVEYLLEWYDEKLIEVKKSEYVVSKISHTKSYEILTNLKSLLTQ